MKKLSFQEKTQLLGLDLAIQTEQQGYQDATSGCQLFEKPSFEEKTRFLTLLKQAKEDGIIFDEEIPNHQIPVLCACMNLMFHPVSDVHAYHARR